MSLRRAKAQQRLQRDLRELAERSWELPTVSALPLEDNMFEWHCNIVGGGEYEGTVLHLKLLFPETYPHQPPEVVLMSRVCHPHVFGDHVCLDMLEEGQWSDPQERDAEFTGWSTCYSVFSILMQLQAFLFDLGNGTGRTRASAQRCECFCGHGLHRVYPPLPEPLPPPSRPPVLQDPFADDASSTRDSSEEGEVLGTVSRAERWGALVRMPDGELGRLPRAETPRGWWLEAGDRVACRVRAREPRLTLTMLRSQDELMALCARGERVAASVTGIRPSGVLVDVGGHAALLRREEMDLLPKQPIQARPGQQLQVRLLGEPGPRLEVSARALFLRAPQARRLLDGEVDLGRLHCFHSKEGRQEAVLGIGVSLEAEAPAATGAPERHHLSSIYDVLALGSFQDGVRRGVWKQKFREFLPLALDAEHFGRARPSLEDSLARLSSGAIAEKTRSHGKSREDREAEFRARVTLDEYREGGLAARPAPPSMVRPTGAPFEPEMVFEVLPKLMNSQVVMLSSGQLWRCQKALEGYFAYHHLLLHCLQAYPRLRARMETKLERFQADPEARGKGRVPNLGEFLCYVSASDRLGWDELGVPVLEEAFDRNVLWILRQAPHLGELSDCGLSQARLRRSFAANRTSLRLLMFQVAFLQLVKPPHLHETGARQCRAASCLLARKDRCKGLPGPGEAEWLFQRCLDILEVEDFGEFLELVGAAPMSKEEICRWLRHSILRSISKGYHNPRLFAALAEKARASRSREAGEVDPEDLVMDSRPKQSKAEKRARRQQAHANTALQARRDAEFQVALSWARFHAPHGYQPRQTCVFVDQGDLGALEAVMDKAGQLTCSFQGAPRGYKLLDGTVLSKVKSFPVRLWLGLGCTDCGRLVRCEISGRCMPCCHRAVKESQAPRDIKGLAGPAAPMARFAQFQAAAVMPVQWEVQVEVGFDGLVADVAPLRAALAEDLTVEQPIRGGTVFCRVERAGKRLWEKSPEQAIWPGSRLVAGWQGVTDACFQTKIRGMTFVLLQDTMHNLATREDLGLLKMARTSCPDHRLRDEATQEIIWDRPCKNCRGFLRLRFAAPARYAQRRAQLEGLTAEQLAHRAQLCGLEDEAGDAARRRELVGAIIKSEGIIR